MKNTVNTRLSEVLKSLKIDIKEAARRTGIEHITIKRIVDGETLKPTSGVLNQISAGLGVSFNYLYRGEGEMFESEKEVQAVNPWKDAMISQMASEIQNLREMLKLALNGSFPLVLDRTGTSE